MAGLIFANLGKGLADVGRDIGKQAFQLELMRLEEEKLLRIDEIKRDRDITSAKRKIEEVDPLQTASDANRTKVVGAAETSVLADRENALRPGKVETAKQTGLVAGEVERSNLAAYAADPKAREGVKAKTADSESSATRATAAAANFELSQKRALGDLRTQLSKTTDPDQRAALEQQIKDLSTAGTKSYADMVTAAGHYRMLAQNLRKDAENALGSDTERDSMLQRARYYEQQADAILSTTTSARLGKPKATSGPNAENVGTAGTSKYKEGDVVNLKNGGRGRVVNIDGKLMVQPL